MGVEGGGGEGAGAPGFSYMVQM